MADVLLLSRADLEKVVVPSVLKALEEAFRAETRGEWDTPKRISAHTAHGGLLAMPCGGGTPVALGAKLVTTFSSNTSHGLPGVSGLYALFDPETGVPLAVMDGAYLTLVRTAAVSAIATRLLAQPGSGSLGVIGAGAQAEFHVRLIATVRPIVRVVIWGRRLEAAEAAVTRLRTRSDLRQVSEWVAAGTLEQAADNDVVVTATAATEALLRGAWLRAGSHVNAIGAHTQTTRELHSDVVVQAATLAVETAATLLEAGDFQIPERESGNVVGRVITLGSLLHGAPRANGPASRSVFKSCGVAFEDLATARLAFDRARQGGLGTRFNFT